MDKLNVGVVGVGFLGSLHARIYHQLEDVTLVGVCDCYKKRAKKIAKRYHTDYYLNYKDLINKVQAVSIVVPTHLHYKIAKDFLNAGVNVLIEKPITRTLEEADELIDIAKKNNLILQVGHIERFNSAIQAVESLLKEPRFIECHRMGPFKKRVSDIGVVLDLMIHDIDIVLGLVRSEVRLIEAVGVKIVSDHEDIANVRFTFENGTISDLIASRVNKKTRRTISIFQKDSFISLNYADQSAIVYTKKGSGTIIKKRLRIMKEEPLKKELESFADCVMHKRRPLVSGEEGRRALSVALEIGKKIRETTER